MSGLIPLDLWAETLEDRSAPFEDRPQSLGAYRFLRERYTGGEVALHLHLWVRSGRLDAGEREWVAVCAEHVPLPHHFVGTDTGTRDGPREVLGGSDLCPSDVDRVEHPMLVLVPRPMEQGQPVLPPLRMGQPRVRLKSLHDCPVSVMGTEHRVFALLLEPGPVLTGEDGEPGFSFRWDVPPVFYETGDELVEHRPQVVEELAEDDSPLCRRLAAHVGADQVVGVAVPVFGQNLAHVAVGLFVPAKEVGNVDLQGSQVLLCPV